MPASTMLPRCRGAARWQQRSASAAALPEAVRNSTTGSPQIRRASGLSLSSSAHAPIYQALRSNILDLPQFLAIYAKGTLTDAGAVHQAPLTAERRPRADSDHSADGNRTTSGFRVNRRHAVR